MYATLFHAKNEETHPGYSSHDIVEKDSLEKNAISILAAARKILPTKDTFPLSSKGPRKLHTGWELPGHYCAVSQDPGAGGGGGCLGCAVAGRGRNGPRSAAALSPLLALSAASGLCPGLSPGCPRTLLEAGSAKETFLKGGGDGAVHGPVHPSGAVSLAPHPETSPKVFQGYLGAYNSCPCVVQQQVVLC